MLAEIDHTFPLEFRRRAEDILIEVKNNYHFQIFAGVKHGFAIRGDPEVENESKSTLSLKLINSTHAQSQLFLMQTGWAKEESARVIIDWFSRWSK